MLNNDTKQSLFIEKWKSKNAFTLINVGRGNNLLFFNSNPRLEKRNSFDYHFNLHRTNLLWGKIQVINPCVKER